MFLNGCTKELSPHHWLCERYHNWEINRYHVVNEIRFVCWTTRISGLIWTKLPAWKHPGMTTGIHKKSLIVRNPLVLCACATCTRVCLKIGFPKTKMMVDHWSWLIIIFPMKNGNFKDAVGAPHLQPHYGFFGAFLGMRLLYSTPAEPLKIAGIAGSKYGIPSCNPTWQVRIQPYLIFPLKHPFLGESSIAMFDYGRKVSRHYLLVGFHYVLSFWGVTIYII